MALEDYIDFEDFQASSYADYTYDVKHILQETEKAWNAFLSWPEDRAYWLPKSKCTLSKDKKRITIPGWLSKAKGMKPHYGGDY